MNNQTNQKESSPYVSRPEIVARISELRLVMDMFDLCGEKPSARMAMALHERHDALVALVQPEQS